MFRTISVIMGSRSDHSAIAERGENLREDVDNHSIVRQVVLLKLERKIFGQITRR
jgi:hypothetical protein